MSYKKSTLMKKCLASSLCLSLIASSAVSCCALGPGKDGEESASCADSVGHTGETSAEKSQDDPSESQVNELSDKSALGSDKETADCAKGIGEASSKESQNDSYKESGKELGDKRASNNDEKIKAAGDISEDEFKKLSPEKQEEVLKNRYTLLRYRLTEAGLGNVELNHDEMYNLRQIVDSEETKELFGKGFKRLIQIGGIVFILRFSGDIIDHIKNFYTAGNNALKKYFYKFTCKGISTDKYEEVLSRVESRLRAELVGQDEAIESMIKIIRGYLESMVQAKVLGKKFEGGLILYLTGNPATGKSTAMSIIEKEMGLTSCVIRSSDATEDKGNKAETVAARLTKPEIQDNGKTKVSVDTPLTMQIKTGIPTLYCFDEIDKMRILDSVLQKRGLKNENGKIMGSSVDEMLRNFGDTGQINGIDASGSILIATSNETPEQLSELESSLYNRYKGCHIHFKDFTKENYAEIINRKMKDIKEYYKNTYNVDVVLDKSAMEYYSTKFEKENSGGRGVEALMNEFRSELKNYTNSVKEFENTTLSVNYDTKADRLYIKSV